MLSLNAVHRVEDVLMHQVHLHAKFHACGFQLSGQRREADVAVLQLNQHNHSEQIAAHDVLAHVNDVDVVFKQSVGNLGNYAGAVLARYS